MKKTVVRFISFLILFVNLAGMVFAADTYAKTSSSTSDDTVEPEPYHDDEFPQWAKDMRRTEIVTLGAVPFITIGISAGYGAYKYYKGEMNTFPNPFSKDDGYSNKEIWGIVGTSLGVSAAIGITDLIISLVKRNNARKEQAAQDARRNMNIRKISPEEAHDMLRNNAEVQEETSDSESFGGFEADVSAPSVSEVQED